MKICQEKEVYQRIFSLKSLVANEVLLDITSTAARFVNASFVGALCLPVLLNLQKFFSSFVATSVSRMLCLLSRHLLLFPGIKMEAGLQSRIRWRKDTCYAETTRVCTATTATSTTTSYCCYVYITITECSKALLCCYSAHFCELHMNFICCCLYN